jgi:hypothetical protein
MIIGDFCVFWVSVITQGLCDARDAGGTHVTPEATHWTPKGRRDAEDAEVAEP